MSDHPGTPEHDEPSAAELDRVRALLAGLGEEPAPPAVVARLERVLDSQLPAPGAVQHRRPRRWMRRAVVGALPVAALVAGALFVSQQGGSGGTDQQSAAKSTESLSQESASVLAAPAATEAADAAGAADSGLASPEVAPAAVEPAPDTAARTATVPATPEELRRAALDAYRETRRVLLDRRTP